MSTVPSNLKVQKWITFLAITLFLCKIVAYNITNSLAILSDALESIVNVLAALIGFYSLYVAAKPSDEEHPYGHGKAEFISAAIEGGLIVAAGILIVYETISHLIVPQTIQQLDWGLVLVGITAVINYIAGWACIRVGNRSGSLALQASGKHLHTDTYSTLGVIAGLALMYWTGIIWIDKVVALAMSVFIINSGYHIVRRSLAGIMDEQDKLLLGKIVVFLNQKKRINWIDLHNLRVIKYGTRLHIDCHLTVPWYLNVHEAHVEIDGLITLIQEEFGDAIEFFVHTDGCLPFSCNLCEKTSCPVRQHQFKHRVEWNVENLLTNKKHQIKTL